MTQDSTRALRERHFYPYLFQSLARDVAMTVLDLRAGERVLEVGCGRGEGLLKLAALVTSTGFAAGVDRDPAARALCDARLREAGYHHFELYEALPEALPAAGGFQAACLAYPFGRRDDEACKRLLSALRRLLSPMGRAAICGVTFAENTIPKALAGPLRAVGRWVGQPQQLPRRAQGLAVDAGFDVDRRLYLEQRGLASEVLLLRRRESLGIRQ